MIDAQQGLGVGVHQDAGKIRLQHFDNNHLDAHAKDPQAEVIRNCRNRLPH